MYTHVHPHVYGMCTACMQVLAAIERLGAAASSSALEAAAARAGAMRQRDAALQAANRHVPHVRPHRRRQTQRAVPYQDFGPDIGGQRGDEGRHVPSPSLPSSPESLEV